MMTEQDKSEQAKQKAELKAHKKGRVAITKDIVYKDDDCVDHFSIPDTITTDVSGKLLFGNIFAGYMQDSQTWRYK